MALLEWIQFLAGLLFLLTGLIIFAIEVYGTFRFRYVLNRMHTAAIGDTFGIGVSMLGLMIWSGLQFTTLKMALVVMFLWFASPVSSHLIARLEVAVNEDLEKYCEVEKE